MIVSCLNWPIERCQVAMLDAGISISLTSVIVAASWVAWWIYQHINGQYFPFDYARQCVLTAEGVSEGFLDESTPLWLPNQK